MSPHPTHKLVGLWVVALQLWFRIFQLCEWRQKLSFQLVWDPKANIRKKKIMAIGQTPWPVRKIPHGSLSAYWKLKHAWWLWLSDEYILYCNEKKNMWFGEPHGWVMKTYASFILCFPYWVFHFSKIWHIDMFLGSWAYHQLCSWRILCDLVLVRKPTSRNGNKCFKSLGDSWRLMGHTRDLDHWDMTTCLILIHQILHLSLDSIQKECWNWRKLY